MRFVAKAQGLMLAWTLTLLLSACGGGDSAPPAPPSIASQPVALSVDDGAVASFSVQAQGGGTLSYQWQRNEQPIAGAIAASYTTPPLTLSDTGASYRVQVSNGGGSVFSQAVPVTVRRVAPKLMSQPQSASVDDGAAVAFSVTLSGSKPFVYTWMRNGIEIPGAQSESLKIEAATMADNGASFSVKVGNSAGVVSSEGASLTVRPVPPEILRAPAEQIVSDGALASFSVQTKGSGPLAFQWLADGQAIAGATASSYSFSTDYADNGKRISVRVSNAYGSLTSEAVLLTVNPLAPTPNQELKTTELAVGQAATLSVSSGGTRPLSYQWERSDDAGGTWRPIDGATGVQVEIPSATLAWAGARLRVKVSNVAGTVASAPILLNVRPQVRILAGGAGGNGYADGKGAAVRFNTSAQSLAVDAAGNVYVPDGNNSVIRKVTPDGQVSTLTGRYNQGYDSDGPLDSATFNYPVAMTGDAKGHLYVATPRSLRRIAPDGQVTTLAGNANCCGSHADGEGSKASFNFINGMALAADGTFYVIDSGSRTVRKISPAGVVSTLAGKPNSDDAAPVDGRAADARFVQMGAMALDAQGNVYVSEGSAIRQVAPDGTVRRWAGTYGNYAQSDGYRLIAGFQSISSMAFDDQGRLIVAESNGSLRRIEADGQVVTLLAASAWPCEQRDGPSSLGRACYPAGLTWSPRGYLLFVDHNSAVRRFHADRTVDTLAGMPPQTYRTLPGKGTAARFGGFQQLQRDATGQLWVATNDWTDPVVRVDAQQQVVSAGLGRRLDFIPGSTARARDGSLYLLDRNAGVIRKMAPDGGITVLAGRPNNTEIGKDGKGEDAVFNNPAQIVLDASDNLYVTEWGSHLIRRVDPAGKVTTIAGQAGQCGYADGPKAEAKLCYPDGLAIDAQGHLYVSEWTSHLIRRISPDGTVSTFAGTPNYQGLANGYASRFNQPGALAFDSRGNLYVVDVGNALIRRITPSGYATTVIGTGQRALLPGLGGSINEIKGLVVTADDRLIFSSEGALVGD